MHTPVFFFIYDGKEYRVRSLVSSNFKPEIGSQVKLRIKKVDPALPYRISYDLDGYGIAGAVIAGVILPGILLIVL